jgi:aryl-alcohol dehydrogenase-like predicted oxidoreductase
MALGEPGISRRAFLALGAAAAAAPLVPAGARAARPATRVLGRTRLAVSEVGMGVMITPTPDVVRAALDAGVTYFDTARAYMGGRNEAILGEGLGARRTHVTVATKCHPHGGAQAIVASCEESLRALGTDYVDILQLHGLTSREEVLDPRSIEGLETLRAAGKIRFAGVTTHTNMAEVIGAAVEAKVYDTVLTAFNFRNPAGLGEAVASAADAGVGVIAMKVMAGGYPDAGFPGLNPFQAALRWVLRQKGVATSIPSLVTYEQLEQNLAAASASFGALDALSLGAYARAIEGRHCRLCGGCAGQCPRGADVPALMRALMYAEGYGQPGLARETLAAAGCPCAGCGECTVTCRGGIRVPGRIAAALRLLQVPGA